MKRLLTGLMVTMLMVEPGIAQDAPQPKLTLISNVHIFDGSTDRLHEDMHVLIKDNLIEPYKKMGFGRHELRNKKGGPEEPP